MRTATGISLANEGKKVLESWMRGSKTERRLVDRAHIILEVAKGKTNVEIAEEFETRPVRISKWRTRFAQQRLEGLQDAPRTGALCDIPGKRSARF